MVRFSKFGVRGTNFWFFFRGNWLGFGRLLKRLSVLGVLLTDFFFSFVK